MNELRKIEWFESPVCFVDQEHSMADGPFKVTMTNGERRYLCDTCGRALCKILDIEIADLKQIKI